MELIDQLAELLEDFNSLTPEIWEACEREAEQAILAGVRAGSVNLSDRAALEDAAARQAYLQRVLGFMEGEGMLANAEMVMANTWTEADLGNLNDGIVPDRETLDAFRVRCLLVHYAHATEATASAPLAGE